MKKILILSLTLLSTVSLAQSDTTLDSIKTPITKYFSVGVSVSNGQFASSSYPSVEAGIMRKNSSLGLVLGRSCFFNEGGRLQVDDNIKEYFYEIKTTTAYPIKDVSCLVLFGVGGYMLTNRVFVEYGGGFSYNRGIISYSVTLSNWDGTNYITPSISINL